MFFIVSGTAYCHWTESETVTVGTGDHQRTETRTTTYEGKEIYMNTKTYLFGASGATATEMANGTYRYHFSCQLPPLLPASFEGLHGHIRYNIEAVLDIPWRFDKKFIVQFIVVRNDNLNDFPDLKLACHSEEIKHLCCLFCASEPLVTTVTLPYTGYAPGQCVNVQVDYNNRSGTEVERTKIALKRVVRFNRCDRSVSIRLSLLIFLFTSSSTPSSKTNYQTEVMAEVNCDGARGKDVKTINKSITIPQIAVSSNTRYCNVVQIFYEIEIEAKIPGCHKNVLVKIPITIGAIPLRFDGGPFSDQSTGFVLPPPTILPDHRKSTD